MEGVPPNDARPTNQPIGVSRRFEVSRLADQLLGGAYQRIVSQLEPVTERCHAVGLATKRRSQLTNPRTSIVGA
jgi:hypothetical protein